MSRFKGLAGLCLLAWCSAIVAAQTPVLIIDEAWARQAPGADVMAVYLNLRNTSAKPVILIGVRSPIASHSMIHETKTVGGQSQMRMLDKLVVPPGGTTKLAPGGLHLMLSGLKQGTKLGTNVPLILLLADGGEVSVAAAVKPFAATR